MNEKCKSLDVYVIHWNYDQSELDHPMLAKLDENMIQLKPSEEIESKRKSSKTTKGADTKTGAAATRGGSKTKGKAADNKPSKACTIF